MIKTINVTIYFSLIFISFSLSAANDPIEGRLVQEMINFQKCMRGLGKVEQCAHSRTENAILKEATSSGISTREFKEEVLHKAVLQQEPAVVVSALAAQAAEEKGREDMNAIIENNESNKKYWNMGTGAISVIAMVVGFGIGRLSK